jgi:hypothetical protein
MNKVKSIFLSKTFWIVGVAPVMMAVCDAISNGLDWRQVVMAGFGAAAVVLRSVTNSTVSLTGK